MATQKVARGAALAPIASTGIDDHSEANPIVAPSASVRSHEKEFIRVDLVARSTVLVHEDRVEHRRRLPVLAGERLVEARDGRWTLPVHEIGRSVERKASPDEFRGHAEKGIGVADSRDGEAENVFSLLQDVGRG